ncbi:hypothetical protein MANES_01G005033v8 [Manihot esculenta]|uniref:Uncharacterized protein n=1 Tax=Manihot esculenta TaxID=3983 RepID=A0ACB7I9B9_MANES|nr:hypothetical protein MANES_01G005033v8 [Manihot esculenta]
MFQSRVISSILKRNKGAINTVISNFRGRPSPFKDLKEQPSKSFFNGFNSIPAGHHISSMRNMSTAASIGMEGKEGLKFLVTGGPHAQKMVGIWLFGSAAWVFSMVILGGVTRLTRSGLSMTDWKFTGSLPPLSDEEWLNEFEKYKQSPEYKHVNKGMSIEDFKFIYWMEYAHRMWGRGLGIMFALPFSYFLRKGYITLRLGLRLSTLFALGAGQGLIGWWMVKSGLEGHAYNTFPKMGDTWIPEDIFEMKPLIRNFFENTSTVQLDHRILATTTLMSIGALWWFTRKLDIHPAVRSLIGSTVGMAALQVTLGVSTLLSYVPVSLGTAHQAGALTLMTLMILLNHTVRKPSVSLLKSLPQVAKTV